MDIGKLEFEIEMSERRVDELLEDLKNVREERDELREEIDRFEGEFDKASNAEDWQAVMDELDEALVSLEKVREQIREFCADCENEKPKACYLCRLFEG